MDRRRMTATKPSAMSSPSITATATTTITIGSSDPSSSSSQQEQQQPEVLFLPLSCKKKVTWKEGTEDNEFIQKKSSKKCCIFHKEKSFDEDDSDEDDNPDHSDKHAHDHSDGVVALRVMMKLVQVVKVLIDHSCDR
ncbi:hypothetical protein HN51_063278 [Arachis hypogaea]|uniref:Protein phosphatase inhibitor n=1 Tax=Arachis hypogaea TaxID=3818 RepID=A0A445AYN4_ARAHY|nr:hypothetical protein Ahy_B01g056380 [Arachis hypogaea]